MKSELTTNKTPNNAGLRRGILADARTSRFPPHNRASRGRADGQKFIFPTPFFLFARLLEFRNEIFWRG